MKALIQILMVMSALAPNVAQADRVATGRPALIDVPLSVLTPCQNCDEMEELQKFFKARHKDLRLKGEVRKKIARVYAFADYLASLDQAKLRSPHYNREIKTFMALAADALPYDQATQIAESIAYLNVEIGTKSHWNEVLAELPGNESDEVCRKKFIGLTVAYHECTQRQELSGSDDAPESPKSCKQPTFNVDHCTQQARNKQFSRMSAL